jgi:hypothetical protein
VDKLAAWLGKSADAGSDNVCNRALNAKTSRLNDTPSRTSNWVGSSASLNKNKQILSEIQATNKMKNQNELF